MAMVPLRRSRASAELKLAPRETEIPTVLSRTPVSSVVCSTPGWTGSSPSSMWTPSTSCEHSLRKGPWESMDNITTCVPPSSAPAASCAPSSSSSAASPYPSPLARRLGASRVIPNLYLGSEDDALDAEVLQRHNITHILNLAAECTPSPALHERCEFVGEFIPSLSDDAHREASLPMSPSSEMIDGGMERISVGKTSGDLAKFLDVRPGDGAKPRLHVSAKPDDGHFPACLPACASDTPKFQYLHVPLKDSVDTDIQRYFEPTSEFIRSALVHNKGILVHCRLGVSRSATIVLAYLMRYGGNTSLPSPLTYSEALKLVQLARPSVNPNLGFGDALRQYEAQMMQRQSIVHSRRVETGEPPPRGAAAADDASLPMERASTRAFIPKP